MKFESLVIPTVKMNLDKYFHRSDPFWDFLEQLLIEPYHKKLRERFGDTPEGDEKIRKLKELVGDQFLNAIREVVANVYEHSTSKEWELKIESHPEEIHLFVRDFGPGFDDGIPDEPTGLKALLPKHIMVDEGTFLDVSHGTYIKLVKKITVF